MVDAMAWMVAPTLTLQRQREEVAPRPIVKKQADMAGSGWEAAAVVAAAWQGVGGRRGGGGRRRGRCVRPAIMQRQFPAVLCPRFSSSTVAGYSCAETGTDSANCAVDRRYYPGAALGPVLACPLLCNVGAQFACRVRRHLCRGADADPFGPCVQKIIEILQLQYIDKVIDVGFAGPAVFGCNRGGDTRAPPVAPLSMDIIVAMPVVVQRQLPWFRRQKTAQVP